MENIKEKRLSENKILLILISLKYLIDHKITVLENGKLFSKNKLKPLRLKKLLRCVQPKNVSHTIGTSHEKMAWFKEPGN